MYVVAVHEIAHCLGLTPSRSADSIMYPTYKHELSKQSLERIQKPYGRPDTKIFDNDGLSIRVKSKEKHKIKLLIEKM